MKLAKPTTSNRQKAIASKRFFVPVYLLVCQPIILKFAKNRLKPIILSALLISSCFISQAQAIDKPLTTKNPKLRLESGVYSHLPHTIPYTEDFEFLSGHPYFDNTSGNSVNWAVSTSYYHTGSQSRHNAYTNSNSNILLETRVMDLTSTTIPYLEFWHIAKTEVGWDRCYVEISTDGGTSWKSFNGSDYKGTANEYASREYFHENSYSIWGTSVTPDNGTWWKKETFSLEAYSSSANVKIRFRLTSDGSVTLAGWYIDDISVFSVYDNTPIFVDADASGSNNGTSWTNAYTDLQVAIDAAATGDNVWVAGGTYKPTSAPDGSTASDRDKSFHLSKDIKIFGGFAGTETSLSQRNLAANTTTLSGDLGTPNVNTDNAYHVFITANLTNAAILDGFTIRDGNANGSNVVTYETYGYRRDVCGGMDNASSNPTIRNLIITANYGTYAGGMYNINASPKIYNTVFWANSSTQGAGMYNNTSNATVTNCTFYGNSASTANGGIFSGSSTIAITNTIFWENTQAVSSTVAGADIGGGTHTVTYSITQQNSNHSTGTGVINNQNPLFTDAANGNFSLLNGSPAMNVGRNSAWTSTGLNTDIAGNKRPNQTVVDMGAYEYSSNVIFVDLNATGPVHDGSSWTNAYQDLQEAIDNASPPNPIWVAAGTYIPTSSPDNDITDIREKAFHLSSDRIIYGGFDGTETMLSERDWVANETILKDTSSTAVGGLFHIMITANLTANTLFDGFKIKSGGNSTVQPQGNTYWGKTYYPYFGGGMYTIDSDPTLNNIVFESNINSAMHNESSDPSISNVVFIKNTDGIFNNNSNPKITNATFYDNRDYGIYNTNSSPTVINSIFWENGTKDIANQDSSSTPNVSYCLTQANSTYSAEVNGIINNQRPLFVDVQNGDLRLYQDSPAIDAGDNAGWAATGLNKDILGNPRPQNGTVDMGAYEGGVAVPVIYVDKDASGGANDGSSWANAYVDLQQAMDSAKLDNQIWVAEGTYLPPFSPDETTTNPRNRSFHLNKDIKIYGGFAATETQLSERDWANNKTILSGDIGTPNYDLDNSYHVFIMVSLTNSAVIDGFTIQDGRIESGTNIYFGGGNFEPSEGAGLSLNNSSPLINNIIFKNNRSLEVNFYSYGGGMYADNGSPKISNTIFWGNSSKDEGGGLYASSYVTITNTTFYGNESLSGGAIYVITVRVPTIINSIFRNNTQGGDANALGADISANNTTANISYSLIQSNINYSGNTGIINNQDPLFIDAANGNFELKTGSPAIDMGSNAAWNATGLGSDFLGTPRPQNSTVDMGAFEHSSIIYVDKDATSGGNNGTSWANAHVSLQDAIDAAAAGNQIWVAEGNYLPLKDPSGSISPTDARDKTFHLSSDIKMFGGFNGTETQLTQRDWLTYPTTLSGDIDNNAGNNLGNAYHVLIAANLSAKTIIDGFIVSAGNANGNNSTFSFGNPAQAFRRDNAGGLYLINSKPQIRNNVFKNNFGDFGGGAYSHLSSPIISNTVFWQNSASQGAGIFINGISSLRTANTTFYENAASVTGGAILNNGSNATISNTIFWNNTKNGANNTAGADFNNVSGTPLVTYCLTQAGSAYAGGLGNVNNKFPNFVDAASGNFKLSKTSQVINKGNNTAVIEQKDMAYLPRIKLGNVDMGAFEFQGTPYTNAIYVKVDALGNNDGSSWQDAYVDLQTAIDEQKDALDIWVAKGTYLPLSDHTGNTSPKGPRDKTFHLSNDMKIYGGFLGTESLLSERDWLAHETVLSGDFSDDDVVNNAGATLSITGNTENAYHVFITANLTNAAVIDGLTIKGGNADNYTGRISYNSQSFGRSDGGGMCNIDSKPSIVNMKFYGNSASEGGGLYNRRSPLLISNTTFSQNFASVEGGGIYNYLSSPIITNSLFSENNSVTYGGGLSNKDSFPEIISSTFSKNKSKLGGAVNNYSSNATFSKCIFTENEAISTNASEAFGGGMYNGTSSRVTITNSIFSRNSSEDYGGGINNFNYSHSDIFNTTFSGNSALIGGGISSSPNSDSDVTNSIFWDNLQNGTNDVSGADIRGTATIAYSLTQENSDFSSGTGIINNQDPLFTDAANDLFQLKCGSPAIDQGTTITGTPIDDITGFTRVGNPDLGAYEFQESTVPLTLTESIADGTNPTYSGVGSITSEWPILNTNNAVFKAGQFIELKPGFSVAPTAGEATVFRAEIGGGCL